MSDLDTLINLLQRANEPFRLNPAELDIPETDVVLWHRHTEWRFERYSGRLYATCSLSD